MINSLSLAKLEVHDELDIKNKPELRNLLEVEERILYSGMMSKINKKATSQERIFVVTTKHLYNIQPEDNILSKISFFIAPQSSVKRKIQIEKVYGITVSSSPSCYQFVIHIDQDYDYRYDSKEKRDRVFRSICLAYFKTLGKEFPLYIKNDTDLSIYQTSDDDVKVGVHKKPTEGKILINKELLDNGLPWIIQNKTMILSGMKFSQPSTVDFRQQAQSQMNNIPITQSVQFQGPNPSTNPSTNPSVNINPFQKQSSFPLNNNGFQSPVQNPSFQAGNNNMNSNIPQNNGPAPSQNPNPFQVAGAKTNGSIQNNQNPVPNGNQNSNPQQNQSYNAEPFCPPPIQQEVKSNAVNYNNFNEFITNDYAPSNHNVNVNFAVNWS